MHLYAERKFSKNHFIEIVCCVLAERYSVAQLCRVASERVGLLSFEK
jgi:hypothetical protein